MTITQMVISPHYGVLIFVHLQMSHSFIHSMVHPLVGWFIPFHYPSIYWMVRSFIPSSIHPSIHPFIHCCSCCCGADGGALFFWRSSSFKSLWQKFVSSSKIVFFVCVGDYHLFRLLVKCCV